MWFSYLSIWFLVQDCTKPHSTSISVHLEGFGKVIKGQNWGRGAQTPKHIKSFLSFLHSLNFSFLMGCTVTRNLIIEGVGDFGKTLNEVSIVVCKPQEASQLCNCSGNRSVLDSFIFMTIALDALLGNIMPQINYTGFEELTLSGL